MNPRRPPEEPKDRALDEIPIAPPEDRDPPDHPPGRKSADPKDDPSSSKSPKKAPSRKRFRLAQDPGGPVEAPGASRPLDDEAPMNALSPAKAKTAKPSTTKATLPQRVTKPEVQRHHNLSATVVRGPKVENGEVRWYWRIDRCANAALGVTERETVFHKWLTVTEAQSELADLVIRGAHRPQVAFAGQRIVTFADLIDADAAARGEPAHLQADTLSHWACRRRWLKALLGTKVILTTSKDELERLFLGTVRDGRSPNTVIRAVRVLRNAWRWAFEERLVTVKPPTLSLGRSYNKAKLTPTRAQISAIVQALKGEGRLIVEVLAVTGARIGEIVSLRRCDYDPSAHWLTVNGKTGPRRIPIDETLRDRLAARADGTTAPLFQWNSRSTVLGEHGDWVRRLLDRTCRSLNMPTFTPHGFRRAAVNFYIEQGYDAKAVAALLGHSVHVLMEYYRSPAPETIERMVSSARPGDFSTSSPTRRKALGILPELLKDEQIMADPEARDALLMMLRKLGGGHVKAAEPKLAPVEQAGPAADEHSADSLSVEAPAPAAVPRPSPKPQSRAATTPAPVAPDRRPVAPRPSTQARPGAAPSGHRTTTSERLRGQPDAPAHRQAPVVQQQRPVVEASAARRAESPMTAPANAPALRTAALGAREEPTRGPPRSMTDKLAKG